MQKKMTNKERAKIFAPFDALKGFKEALIEEEIIKIPKVYLSEDQEVIINNILNDLKQGMMIEVIYYSDENKCYLKKTGIFTKIDLVNKLIFVVKNKIALDSIIDIKIISNLLDF